MISIVYCTREENKKHSEHLLKVCGNPKVEIIEYINKGESLTKFYNRALSETKHDIVVFVHDDIIIETKQLFKKIERIFDKNPEYAYEFYDDDKRMQYTLSELGSCSQG